MVKHSNEPIITNDLSNNDPFINQPHVILLNLTINHIILLSLKNTHIWYKSAGNETNLSYLINQIKLIPSACI